MEIEYEHWATGGGVNQLEAGRQGGQWPRDVESRHMNVANQEKRKTKGRMRVFASVTAFLASLADSICQMPDALC